MDPAIGVTLLMLAFCYVMGVIIAFGEGHKKWSYGDDAREQQRGARLMFRSPLWPALAVIWLVQTLREARKYL